MFDSLPGALPQIGSGYGALSLFITVLDPQKARYRLLHYLLLWYWFPRQTLLEQALYLFFLWRSNHLIFIP